MNPSSVILGYSHSIVEEKKNPYMENLLSQEVEGWRLVLKGEKWQIWLVCFLRILFLLFTQKLWNSAGFNMLARSFVSFMDWNERDDFATMPWVKINSAAQKKQDWRMSSVWHWKYKHDSERLTKQTPESRMRLTKNLHPSFIYSLYVAQRHVHFADVWCVLVFGPHLSTEPRPESKWGLTVWAFTPPGCATPAVRAAAPSSFLKVNNKPRFQ